MNSAVVAVRIHESPAVSLHMFLHSRLLQKAAQFLLVTFCLQMLAVAHVSARQSGPMLADAMSDCRERGWSGSSSGGLGGAGGGGQSELQLQRQRVITRRKALQRKLAEVVLRPQIPVLAGIALLLMLISHRCLS